MPYLSPGFGWLWTSTAQDINLRIWLCFLLTLYFDTVFTGIWNSAAAATVSWHTCSPNNVIRIVVHFNVCLNKRQQDNATLPQFQKHKSAELWSNFKSTEFCEFLTTYHNYNLCHVLRDYLQERPFRGRGGKYQEDKPNEVKVLYSFLHMSFALRLKSNFDRQKRRSTEYYDFSFLFTKFDEFPHKRRRQVGPQQKNVMGWGCSVGTIFPLLQICSR